MARWLRQRHGIERTIWSVYYRLKKCGATLRVPRPVHLKKDPQATAVLTVREVFERCPQVKKQFRGGEFWTDGYYADTVGKHGNEPIMRTYAKQQGRMYKKLHQVYQLVLF